MVTPFRRPETINADGHQSVHRRQRCSVVDDNPQSAQWFAERPVPVFVFLLFVSCYYLCSCFFFLVVVFLLFFSSYFCFCSSSSCSRLFYFFSVSSACFLLLSFVSLFFCLLLFLPIFLCLFTAPIEIERMYTPMPRSSCSRPRTKSRTLSSRVASIRPGW